MTTFSGELCDNSPVHTHMPNAAGEDTYSLEELVIILARNQGLKVTPIHSYTTVKNGLQLEAVVNTSYKLGIDYE